MEIIFIIIIMLVSTFIWNVFINFCHTRSNAFEIDLHIESKDDTQLIIINGRGIIPSNKCHDNNLIFISTVWDITNGKESPVLCLVPEFQKHGIFYFQKTVPIPYDATLIKEWVPVGIVIPEICVFPFSKKRKLRTRLSLLNTEGQVIKEYSSEIEFYNSKKGYEEVKKDKIKLFKMELHILMNIAMADGKIDNKEIEFFTQKITTFLENYEGQEKENLKEQLNLLLKKSYEQIYFKRDNLQHFTNLFKEISTDAHRYNLIKSCTEMMSIDKNIDEKELKIIDNISNQLGLRYNKVNELKDIHILKGSNVDPSNPEVILGIKSEWNYDKIRMHLNKQFTKWNARMQGCSDEKERQQVQNMLNLIAKTRLKYEKKAG